jgi:diguanylate cyclase (GGDEF)-like protein
MLSFQAIPLPRPLRLRPLQMLALFAGVMLALQLLGDGSLALSAHLAVSTVAVGIVVVRVSEVAGDRLTWVLCAIGMGLLVCGDASSSDFVRLAAYPALYAGIVVLARRCVGDAHASFWLDGLIVFLAASAYVVAMYLPGLQGQTGASPALLAMIACPAATLALVAFLAGTTVVLGRPGPQVLLLMAALALVGAGDVVEVVNPGATPASADLADSAGMLLLACASWSAATPGRIMRVGGWWEFVAPVAITILAFGIEVAAHFHPLPDEAVYLAAAAFVAALMRLGWTLREVRSLTLHRRDALTDALTGLPNRRALFRELEVLTSGGGRSGTRLSLLLLDLDGFKELNDTLGHQAGDELLMAVGRRLSAALPAEPARLGGDEFAVIVPGDEDPWAVAQGAVSALEEPLEIEGISVAVRASVGIARFPGDASDARELARRADVAMYQAKRTRLPVALYESERDEHSRERLALAADLRAAFERQELWLAYQPQVDITRGVIEGAEALIRWKHPTHGAVPPPELLAVAERVGLMPRLTEWVLEHAVTQTAEWRRRGVAIRVAVNVSAMTLVDENLPQHIGDVLARHNLTPANLVVEVTEDAVMRDPRRSIAILERVKALGVGIAVDDFGTGHSSLEQLRRLPADELKLDRSFVQPMDRDPADAAVVRSVVDLGRALGLRVVAEGVETPEVFQMLRAMGCHVAQGFGIARPMPPGQFERFVCEPSEGARRVVPDIHAAGRPQWRRGRRAA